MNSQNGTPKLNTLPDEMKLCPYCAEGIKFAVIKCKHCCEFLTDDE